MAAGQFAAEEAVRFAVDHMVLADIERDDLSWVKPYLDEARAQIARRDGFARGSVRRNRCVAQEARRLMAQVVLSQQARFDLLSILERLLMSPGPVRRAPTTTISKTTIQNLSTFPGTGTSHSRYRARDPDRQRRAGRSPTMADHKRRRARLAHPARTPRYHPGNGRPLTVPGDLYSTRSLRLALLVVATRAKAMCSVPDASRGPGTAGAAGVRAGGVRAQRASSTGRAKRPWPRSGIAHWGFFASASSRSAASLAVTA